MLGTMQVPALKSYSKEAVALFRQMSVQPSEPRKVLCDRLIRQMKAGGVWDRLDIFYMMAAHDEQAARLNWKSPGTFTATATNSPTFTANGGYASNGSTSRVDTGWTPPTHGVNYVQDSALMGIYINAGSDGAQTNFIMGAVGTSTGAVLNPQFTGNLIRGRLNTNASANFSGSSTTRFGLTVLDRSASTTTTFYRDGVSGGTEATASVSPSGITASIYFGGVNDRNIGFLFPMTNRMAAGFLGGSMNANQHMALYNAIAGYLRPLGAA